MNAIAFFLCAASSALCWTQGNQGLSIWLGFLALANLVMIKR